MDVRLAGGQGLLEEAFGLFAGGVHLGDGLAPVAGHVAGGGLGDEIAVEGIEVGEDALDAAEVLVGDGFSGEGAAGAEVLLSGAALFVGDHPDDHEDDAEGGEEELAVFTE